MHAAFWGKSTFHFSDKKKNITSAYVFENEKAWQIATFSAALILHCGKVCNLGAAAVIRV